MIKIFKSSRLHLLILSILLAALFLILTAGPNLAAPSVFDWDTYAWPTGSLSETYSGIGSPATVFTYTFSGDTNRLAAPAPETNHLVNGGTSPPQRSLYIATDYVTNTESISLTLDLSQSSTNVSFVVFDIDRDRDGISGIDTVIVNGFDSQGTPVTPTLSAVFPSCVSITGNIATGMCNVNDNQDDGNVTVSFDSEINKIVLNFGNAGDRLLQNMALHDINFDPATTPPTPTDTPPVPTDTPTATPVTPTDTPPVPTDTPTATPEPDHYQYFPATFKQ